MKKANVLFYIPADLESKGKSASKIRPVKMVKALRASGYSVTIIKGSYQSRKKRIKIVLRKIREGIDFEFLYAENLTIPFWLSEKNHVPRLFYYDLLLFKSLRAREIPLFCFYRDIYWNLSDLDLSKSRVEKYGKFVFHYLELFALKYFDKVYLPSNEMKQHVPVLEQSKLAELPPGCDLELSAKMPIDNSRALPAKRDINILYVGGVSAGYPMHELFRAVSNNKKINLLICTRESDWLGVRDEYTLDDNIHVVHVHGEDLRELYEWADLCSLVFAPQIWRSFAFPYKFFEYLSFGKPTLAVDGTPPARIIKENKFGVVTSYNEESLTAVFEQLTSDSGLLSEARNNIAELKQLHSWDRRINTLADEALIIKRQKRK